MPALQLSFHGSFALKKEDVLKILQAAQGSQGLKDTRECLMNRTGLGNEKVLRIKSWAIRSGLVRGDRLTPEGELILAKDPYLQSPITDWYMHFYLSLGTQGTLNKYKGKAEILEVPPPAPPEWGGWTWFVYSFLPEYFTFSLENLLYEASLVFTEEKRKDLKTNLEHILKAYAVPPDRAKTETPALMGCGFVQLVQKNDYERFQAGEAILPNPYMIGYILAKLWQRDFGETTSVVTDDILNHKLGLAPLLGLEPATLQDQLDKLEIFGLIEQRRTVPPFQTVRRWESPLALLEQAYANT